MRFERDYNAGMLEPRATTSEKPGCRPARTPAVPRPASALGFSGHLDHAPLGHVEVDPDGYILHANRSACARLGLDSRQTEALPFVNFLPPQSVSPFARLVKELLATKIATSGDLQLKLPGRPVAWVRLDGIVLEEGERETCLFSMVDISERRAVAARLRASEQRLLGLIESLPDSIFVVRAGRVVFSNASAQRLAAAANESVVPGVRMQDLVVPADQALLAPLFAAGDGHLSPAAPVEIRFRGRGGRYTVADTTWMSMLFEDTSCLLCVARDVTERRQIDAKLAQADRLSAVGVLAAGVAHEINNPLTYIFLHLENIGAAVDQYRVGVKLDDDDVRESIDRAMVGAGRVRDIVKDLQSCTRDDDVVTRVSVNDVIEKTLELASPQLRFKTRVETCYGDLPAVEANFGRLSQVFLNLFINAAQAFVEGRSGDNRLQITTGVEGGQVVVVVQDTGCGIPERAKARLFEPFYTTKGIGGGSGLGLYISHQHLKRFGGTISLVDSPTFSTTFVVRLPAYGLHKHQPPQDTRVSPSAGVVDDKSRRSLLIIDDDGIIRKGLETVLQPRFDVVASAASGNEAIELIRRGQPFDLILCDVLMGEGSGPDVHRWLEKYRPDLLMKIAFITGGAYTDDARRFFGERKLPCLEKPFSHDELAEFVDRLLPDDAASSRAELRRETVRGDAG